MQKREHSDFISSQSEKRFQKNKIEEIKKSEILLALKNGEKVYVVLDVESTDAEKKHLLSAIYREIEQSFRTVGAGTGNEEKNDTFNEKGRYKQLVVVKRQLTQQDEELPLVAGYRYGLLKDCREEDTLDTAMGKFFEIQKEFLDAYAEKTIELGTARSRNAIEKSITEGIKINDEMAFYTVFSSLTELEKKYQNRYFLGKMTIPEQYPEKAKDCSLTYLKHFHSNERFEGISPKDSFHAPVEKEQETFFLSLFEQYGICGDFKKDRKLLAKLFKEQEFGSFEGEMLKELPGMFTAYLNLGAKLNYLGTIRNGSILEAGIMVDISEIIGDKKTYFENPRGKMDLKGIPSFAEFEREILKCLK